MTTATLTFKLGFGEDSDDLHFKQVSHAVDSLSALWDIEQELRRFYKYPPEDFTAEQHQLIDELRAFFYTTLESNNINLSELYS